jgi:hypothetical protein
MSMLQEAIAEATRAGGERPMLPARTAFTLHDTYGFPIDLTIEIAREQGLALDRDAFAELMEGQRRRAREAARGREGEGTPVEVYRSAAAHTGTVSFVGYEEDEADTRVNVNMYSVVVNPKDGSVWGTSLAPVPSMVVRVAPGADPGPPLAERQLLRRGLPGPGGQLRCRQPHRVG